MRWMVTPCAPEIPMTSRLVLVTDFWAIPHPAAMHGKSGVICSNCADIEPLTQEREDAWEEEQRELYDTMRSLDADDPFAQERSEDLEEVVDAPLIMTWQICFGCSKMFEIPEHVRDRLVEDGMLLFCPACRP